MSDTQALLSKITALRRRLEQAQGLVADAGQVAESLAPPGGNPHWLLHQKVMDGTHWNSLLDTTLRQVSSSGETVSLPPQLTARARRLLERGQDLLGRLRTLSDALESEKDTDPLVLGLRETVAMADAVLQLIGTFPEAPSVQLRLCDGIEVILSEVARRIAKIEFLLSRRRLENSRIEILAGLLSDLNAGRTRDLHPWLALAKAVVDEVQEGRPLRFFQEEPEVPSRFIAAHSITVAQVAARIVRHDPNLSRRTLDLVLATLVHDIGMLRIPVEILAHAGPLTDSQKRTIESHPWVGAELVAGLMSGQSWLAETTAQHHERVDGKGYPAGLTGSQMEPLARLLALCDVYAAYCTRRPYRREKDPRTALADTLLLAQAGALDKTQAEKLLVLGFYPAGSTVELADGAIAYVVENPLDGKHPNSTIRPVLAILTNTQGLPLPSVRYLDLAQWNGPNIIRSLTMEERHRLLGINFPELVL
ncbi:MAG TPA: HD domain-containing phosphohydrolase [Gemmataceae bacterium]|nr:HD domain-containing phosphohydrolase [Gemmataceae bacterium]